MTLCRLLQLSHEQPGIYVFIDLFVYLFSLLIGDATVALTIFVAHKIAIIIGGGLLC